MPRALLPALSAALLACGGADPRPEPAAPADAPHAHAPGTHQGHKGHQGHEGHEGHDGMPHRFEDADRWAKHFEDPQRDAWQQPDRVVSLLVDRPDLVVADIGAGTGYFAVRFARAVPGGQVHGLDIEPDMVAYMTRRATRESLPNLDARQVPTDDPGLAALPAPADLVFLCNTYHHIGERQAYFTRVREALPPGGRLAIVDYYKHALKGPPADHKLAAEVVIAELDGAGWQLAARHDVLEHQYLLVFTPR